MILSDREIAAALERGDIEIDPRPGEEQYTTSAVDLVLADEFYEHKTREDLHEGEPRGVERDPTIVVDEITWQEFAQQYTKPIRPETDGSIIIKPEEFALGRTREFVTLHRNSKIAARVEGRSTLARLGLAVHITAPTIHAGFRGNIILEMYNFGRYNLRLRPNRLHICQLILERVGQEPRGPVRSPFQDQTRVR